MSTKHVRTAADLVRFGCSLHVECGACGAATTWSAVEVVKRCAEARSHAGVHGEHWRGDLARIKRRLKCARCGAKAAQLIVLRPALTPN